MHRSAIRAQCAPLSCEKRDGCIPWQPSRLLPFGRRHVFTYLTKGREANLQAQTWGVSTGHFFIFRCATLSGSRGRFGQKSPIWTKHGAKSSLRPALPALYERDEIQAVYFAQERSEKGGCNTVCSGGSFFCIETGRDTGKPAWSVTVTYTACRLVHPKPMGGCWNMAISSLRHSA